MWRAAYLVALLSSMGWVSACSNGCNASLTAVNVQWNPSPQLAPMSVEVDMGNITINARCPRGGDQIPSGGSYSCTAYILLMLIPNLDLANTKMVTVTMTTDAGQVLAKDMVVGLGPIFMESS